MHPFRLLLLLSSIFLISYSSSAQSGNCNDDDLDYLAENMDYVQGLVASCAPGCATTADPEGCLQECLESQTPLSIDCIECFNEQMTCALDNCLFPCGFGSDEDCMECMEENCLDDFYICAGIVDEDNDGYTTLDDCDDMNSSINPGAEEIWYDGVDQNCDGLSDFDQDGDGQDSYEFGGMDCDDQDPEITNGTFVVYPDSDGDGFGNEDGGLIVCMLPPDMTETAGDCDDTNENVYPGAPGTGEGIDNDCNGYVQEDELLDGECAMDMNNNGQISTADLLMLLGQFGCSGNCDGDFNNDELVNTADLLMFLSSFGMICND